MVYLQGRVNVSSQSSTAAREGEKQNAPQEIQPPRARISDQIRSNPPIQPPHPSLRPHDLPQPPRHLPHDASQSGRASLGGGDLELDFEEVEGLHADGRDEAGDDSGGGLVKGEGGEVRGGRKGGAGRGGHGWKGWGERRSGGRVCGGGEERVGRWAWSLEVTRARRVSSRGNRDGNGQHTSIPSRSSVRA